MSDFKFLPRIRQNEDGASFTVTAPHGFRDKTWNALHYSLRDVVYRADGEHTQFVARPFPGYTPRAVYAYTVGMMYSLTLEGLLSYTALSMQEHLDRLPTVIDLDCDLDMLTLAELEEALVLRFKYLAKGVVEGWNVLPKSAFGNDHSSNIKDWLNNAEAARRRLFAINPNQTFITREQYGEFLSQCDAHIATIQSVKAEWSALVAEYQSMLREAEGIREEFYAFVASDGPTLDSLNEAMQAAKMKHEAVIARIQAVAFGFDPSPASEAWGAVYNITPPNAT